MATLPLWLADYQLLAAALLLGVMLALAALRQPAQRLAVAKSTLAALAGLALLCALPGWSLVHLLSEPQTSIASVAPTPIETSAASPSNRLLTPPEAPANINPPSPSIEPSATPQLAAAPAKPINWPAWFTAAYATGSAAVTLWLITGALLARRVRQQATPAPRELQELLQQLCGPEKTPPQLLLSDRIAAPVALGLRRPTILLPLPRREGLGEGFPIHPVQSEPQFLPILAHELAHLQHRDLHTLAATRLLLILLWPQPLYWLLRRTIRLDQETLADAAAADRAGRLDYAQQLLAWASTASTQRPPRLAGAVGLWEGPSQLKRRIAMLLNEQFEVMRTCSRRWRWLSVSSIAVLVAALSLVTLQPITDAAEDEAAISVATTPEVVMARKNELLRGIVREKNSVRGYCVDEHGKPLAGAKISLFTYQSTDHAGRPQVFREAFSDERGYFAIDAAIDVEQAKLDGIPVDKPFDSANGWTPISINAHAPGRAVSYDDIPMVLLVQDGDLRMFELRPGKSLSGQVTDAAGRAVAGVQVTAGGYVLSSATTDAKGNYEIRDLYPMDGKPGHQLTQVEFRHPDFALQKAGPATVPGKLDVALHPGGAIEGRVEIQDGANNRPAANVDVMVALFTPYALGQNPPPNVPGAQYSRIIDREWVRTNDAGEYRIQSLAPGDHGVTIVQNELVTNGVAPVAVKPKETTTAPPVVLTRGVTIRVKLIDAETKQPIPFDKLTRGVVNPVLGSPTIPSMQMRREFKAYGDFGEVNVAPGVYSLFVTNRSERLESIDDRLPSGDYPAYHKFQAEEGKDLEFVVPMRVNSSDFVDPPRPATPGIVVEGLDEAPSAGVAPTKDASTSAEPAAKTRHQAMGQAAIVAMPLKPQDPSTENANKLALAVVDVQGAPLAGVEALIYRVSLPQGKRVLARTVATDADGKIVAENLVAPAEVARFKKLKAEGGFIYDGSKGGFVIVLRRAGLATALIFQSPGDLALYGAKRTIIMRPAVKLSGQVTDPAGKPVAGAKVVAGDSFVGGFAIDGVNAVTTDAEGRYEFADRAPFNRAASNKQQNHFLAASAHLQTSPLAREPAAAEDPSVNGVSNLLVSHPDYAVTRVEGGDVPGVADVQLLPAASISGRVVQHGSGDPATGITVHAAGFPDASQGASIEMRNRSGHSAVTTTDATGAYRFSNLPAARYDVWADSGAQEMSDAPWVSRGQSRIDALPGGEPTKVPDLTIGPPAIVQVQLVDAESDKPVELPAGATANLAPQRVDGPSMQQTPLQRVSTTTDGKFDMRLFPGRSRVLLFIHEGAVGTPAIWQTDDDVDSTGEVFDLQSGETISATIKVLAAARVNELRERDMAANKLMEEKKYAEAIAAYSSLIADFPQSHFRVSQQRGHAYNRLSDYAAALADFEASLKLAPDNTAAKFFIASLLATTPIDADRDSRRALEYAEQLAAIARQQDDSRQWLASLLDIQAAAYADLGEFEKAIKIEEEALELSHESQREAMKSRLELYQTNKPFRRAAPAPTTNAPTEKPADQGASKSPTLHPQTTMAVALPPATSTMGKFVAGPHPKVRPTQPEALDLKLPLDSTWRLIPQPAVINLNGAATLGDAVK